MRKNSIKNTRINGEVQKALSDIIRSELKDPRIHPMTSVVLVQVTPDLKYCKAYIRNTPEISFILDQSIEYGVRMSKLIDDVTKDLTDRDEENGEETEDGR